MNNVGVINTFLDTFNSYIDSGFGLLGGEVAFLTTALIVIDVTLAGLFWAWGADEDVMHRLVKKTLYIGFFAFVIGNFSALAAIVFESFAGLGLQASGASISVAEFMRPGTVAQTGFDAGEPLLDAAEELMGFTSFFSNFVQIAVLMISWVIILIAFFILAIQLFITLIEFKLTTLAGFVLLPFALFNKTAFLAEKVLGNVVASGVKVLVLAVIVGIGTGLFAEFQSAFGETPTNEQCAAVALASLALMGLGIFGPGIATGLVSGAPQLGAGAAVGTALAVGGMAAGGAVAGRMALGGAASAAGGGLKAAGAAARGGAFASGAASSAYAMGSLGKSGAGAAAGGMAAMGQAAASGAANAAISPLKKAAEKGAAAMQSSFRSGARAGFTASGGTISGGASPAAPASSGAASAGSSGPPAWARSMKNRQALQSGVSTVAHAVRSGDRGGGGASPNLSQKD